MRVDRHLQTPTAMRDISIIATPPLPPQRQPLADPTVSENDGQPEDAKVAVAAPQHSNDLVHIVVAVPAVSIDRECIPYRKSRTEPKPTGATRRPRVRAQKRQRVRARERLLSGAAINDAPSLSPIDDDALWPEFFVNDVPSTPNLGDFLCAPRFFPLAVRTQGGPIS